MPSALLWTKALRGAVRGGCLPCSHAFSRVLLPSLQCEPHRRERRAGQPQAHQGHPPGTGEEGRQRLENISAQATQPASTAQTVVLAICLHVPCIPMQPRLLSEQVHYQSANIRHPTPPLFRAGPAWAFEMMRLSPT